MATVTFTGVGTHSLGDLLKGYGLIEILGTRWPQARFWWDAAGHLWVEINSGNQKSVSKTDLVDEVEQKVPNWALDIGKQFTRGRANTAKGRKAVPSPLLDANQYDSFAPEIAIAAWAAAIPDQENGAAGKADTASHPWLGDHGQDGSGNYFTNLGKLQLSSSGQKGSPANAPSLDWSLFRRGSPQIQNGVGSGGVFFPESMKRYAVGIKQWIRENDAPVSPWCYALALRGALFLRGSLRRMRFARTNYSAFPFIFEGSDDWESHLPVWNRDHPRTLAELRLQIAQFQVRLKGDAMASNAAEFRAAVAGRGVTAGFDRFYRFVLERRRPGQRPDQYLQQAILRGVTSAGRKEADVRLLVAPLAEHGWLGRLESRRGLGKGYGPGARERIARAECRRAIEKAIHHAIDEPGPESCVGILQALWDTNVTLARQSKDPEAPGVPSVAPPLDRADWERALQPLWRESAEHRVACAIASTLSARGTEKPTGQTTEVSGTHGAGQQVGGLLWQLLPFDNHRHWDAKGRADVVEWKGVLPERDFAELLWHRWLGCQRQGIPFLALRARKTAHLSDIAALFRGELDLREIHRLVPLYALLDWTGGSEEKPSPLSLAQTRPVPIAYGVLRLWLQLAIFPPADEPGERNGTLLRLLTFRSAKEAGRAVALALERLRIRGLPTNEGQRRLIGKAVAQAEICVTRKEAGLLPPALLIPLSTHDTTLLADRLHVVSPRDLQEEKTQ